MNIEARLDSFAITCFRDIADEDYVAARMACRAALVTQFLWCSQQAVEKYLKCILLLNRIEAIHVKHDLGLALTKIITSDKLQIDLSPPTVDYISRLDDSGRYRYLEFSNQAVGTELVAVDRVVWELRRYCSFGTRERQSVLVEGQAPPLVRIKGGVLEKIISDKLNPARKGLLWQNGYFGTRRRRIVKIPRWFRATFPPQSHEPGMVEEAIKYVHLPKGVVKAYKDYDHGKT